MSRDRFDESLPCVLTHSLCNALLSVVLFPVWTSGRVICPICYQEFIPHRKSMETIVCLGLIAILYQRCIMFTAAIVPPCYKVISISHMFCHLMWLNGIYMLVFLIMESNCHSQTHARTCIHKHPSWNPKRASIRRVPIEVLTFLCAIWSNLWPLCACLKHSTHPWLWYQTPGCIFVKMQLPLAILFPSTVLIFFLLLSVVASFSFPWAIMRSWQQIPISADYQRHFTLRKLVSGKLFFSVCKTCNSYLPLKSFIMLNSPINVLWSSALAI